MMLAVNLFTRGSISNYLAPKLPPGSSPAKELENKKRREVGNRKI
jgi:hypothetical protein